MQLTEYMQEEYTPPEIPQIIHKGQTRILICGKTISGRAKHYWNVSFFGVMLPHDNMKQEYVLGHLEIRKGTGIIEPSGIRITRKIGRTGIRELERYQIELGRFIIEELTKL
jgi:hypothetical protein